MPISITDSQHERKPEPLHTATIVGEVTDVNERTILVSFSYEGEPEDREFYWSQIKAVKGSLVVGDRVKGRTELELLPRLDKANAHSALVAIRERAAALARGMANGLSLHVTPEAQEAADRARETL